MTLTFSFDSSATHETAIQWYHDGVPLVDGTFDGVVIVGSTTETLTITNPTIDYDGNYYAVVTDLTVPGCSVETDPITVVIPGQCRLAITAQPFSQELVEGATLVLTVTANGEAGPLTYQWLKDGVELVDGGNISGSTTATLTISSVVTGDAGSYTVVVTDTGIADCSLESSAASVTVDATLPAWDGGTNPNPPCDESASTLVVDSVYAWGLAEVDDPNSSLTEDDISGSLTLLNAEVQDAITNLGPGITVQSISDPFWHWNGAEETHRSAAIKIATGNLVPFVEPGETLILFNGAYQLARQVCYTVD